MIAVLVELVLGDQQRRAGNGRSCRGDAQRFQRFVGAQIGEPVGNGDLAGRTARLAVGETEIGHARQVLKGHTHRDGHAVAIDRVDAFGILGVLAGQRRALGVLHRLDGDADKAEQAVGVVIGKAAGDEIAPVGDEAHLLVGAGGGDAGEAAKGVVLRHHRHAAAKDQLIDALVETGILELGDLCSTDRYFDRQRRQCSGKQSRGDRGEDAGHPRPRRRDWAGISSSNKAASSSVSAPASSSASSRVTARL